MNVHRGYTPPLVATVFHLTNPLLTCKSLVSVTTHMRASFLLFVCLTLLACGSSATRSPETNAANSVSAASANAIPVTEGTPSESRGMSATAACQAIKVENRSILKPQTFAIDFAPFKASCFVTWHDPEFTDPPLDSEYAIYRDGKNVFDFPDKFNGVSVGCWVVAVAFQDVNGDALTDIVVIGKCNGKSDSFYENSVYINDGKAFFTRLDSNYKLSDFTSLKDVIGFAKENPTLFGPSSDASPSNSKS
jgi:hypothetical protein